VEPEQGQADAGPPVGSGSPTATDASSATGPGPLPGPPPGALTSGTANLPPPGALPSRRRRFLGPAPAPRSHSWGLGAFLLVELVYLLVSAAVGVPLLVGYWPPPAWALALALAVPALTAAGLAMGITKLRGNGPRTDLRIQGSWRDVRFGLMFGFGGLIVTAPAAVLYLSFVEPDGTSAVDELFVDVRASLPLAIVIFLIVVFVVPLCEEIVYRGLLWGAVERRWGPWVALLVTTLVFALAHFEFSRTPLLLVLAIPIGLARLYSGGLLASIVAHQINNLLPGIALILGLVGVI
jgi:membrane protease YdiL (CAAX protease family)